ncbi:uncharacterized protein G6M90_00g045830 [Metarhizium brunneum]|uniref:Uncharacterized protein n=1 Tax=Metarhizium brunneum TaxID=500148 RepID=A0A7D5UW34_9HYPO|nr:hypothetical protein G6M90_00g045830 [Metarhizium brunneum]
MSSMPDQAIELDAAMSKLARETVMKRWIEQSIWNSSKASQSSCSGVIDKVKPRPPKSEEELQQKAERRAIHEREHEASRRFRHFISQVSKERDRIHGKASLGRHQHAGL